MWHQSEWITTGTGNTTKCLNTIIATDGRRVIM